MNIQRKVLLKGLTVEGASLHTATFDTRLNFLLSERKKVLKLLIHCIDKKN